MCFSLNTDDVSRTIYNSTCNNIKQGFQDGNMLSLMYKIPSNFQHDLSNKNIYTHTNMYMLTDTHIQGHGFKRTRTHTQAHAHTYQYSCACCLLHLALCFNAYQFCLFLYIGCKDKHFGQGSGR